jgi:fatty-acyl-CoA synthase
MAEIGARARRNTIGDAMRRAGSRFRDRPTLRFGDNLWSFAALDRAADRVARLLAEGLRPGDRVCAFGRNSDGYLLLWIGCARAGLVHVPANYALTTAELDYILRQSGAAAVFTQPALRATADAAGGALLRGTLDVGEGALDVLAVAGDARWDVGEPPGEAVAETDLVQLQYTSGTTGQPKGAMMTHRAMLAQYASATVELEMRRDDRALAALPLYHTAQCTPSPCRRC